VNVKVFWVIPAFLLLVTAVVFGGAGMAEPMVAQPFDEIETFGDAHNVRLLADLLDDEDPMTREQAVKGLGEAHNPAALPHIRRMQADGDVNVRCAVATAAGQYDPNVCGDVILQAIASPDARVVLAGLRSVRRTRFAAAAGDIRKLLDRPEPHLAAVALDTLTQLGQPAAAGQLKRLFRSASNRLRLRAAQNAVLLADPAALRDDLAGLARDASPAVRAAAMAALGNISPAAIEPFVAQAGDDPSPLARRGALWACRNAGLRDRIRPFLDDPSPLVRLAGVRAAGKLRSADCIERIFEIMQQAPDEQTHLAARGALRRIGEVASGAVTDRAGQTLARLADRLRQVNAEIDAMTGGSDERPRLLRKRDYLRRNAGACCWLLGEFKSAVAYDLQLSLLEKLTPNSTVLLELAPALGKIGDKRAVAPLIARLDFYRKCAILCMKAELAAEPCPVPYYHEHGKETTAAIIDGLCRLGASESAKLIAMTAGVKVGHLRLDRAAEVAGRMLPALDGPETRKDIDIFINWAGADGAYSPMAQFEIVKAAGRIRTAAALPTLRKVLNEQRRTRIIMEAAAWSIARITGKVPPIPEPRPNEGPWIVRRAPR